jgi:hypothetical protein
MNNITMPPLRNTNVSLSMHWQVFASNECAQITAQANAANWTTKLPGGPGNEPIFPDAKALKMIERQRLPLGKNAYPLDQINFGASQVNSDAWRFELTGFPADDMPWLARQKKGNYSEEDWQVDIGAGCTSSRKLSFILQLSDPSSYDGGDVILHNMNTDAAGFRKQGTLIVFPSYWLHRTSPVTRGTRHFISGWIHGHSFR